MITADLVMALIESKTVIPIHNELGKGLKELSYRKLSYNMISDTFIVKTNKGTTFEKDMAKAIRLYNSLEV